MWLRSFRLEEDDQGYDIKPKSFHLCQSTMFLSTVLDVINTSSSYMLNVQFVENRIVGKLNWSTTEIFFSSCDPEHQ